MFKLKKTLICLALIATQFFVQGQISTTCFSQSEQQALLSTLQPFFDKSNLIVQQGGLDFKEMDNCVVFNKCNFQNGESPYGSVVLSRNPNQTEVDEDGGK